uniref:Uncharacterized protein n=1 Tax=Hordeum vulgare subsp. vulgare TaxID=112509 RepID=A0A8I6X626_HORVV
MAVLPLSCRDGVMCEFDGTLDHPQCYFHTALTEKDIVAIIKKLTGEPAGKCGQIGLKPFCKINPAPKKGDKFWSRRPKKQAMKTAKPPSKKAKGKGKSAAAEPSEVDESQVGDALSENEDNESQEDSVEVISVSSDSSPSPPKPARRICGKVPFSHPNAHLDPNFLLKKTQHASNRKTRSHSRDLISGLPATNKRKPSENSPPTSGDSVMSTLPPMIRVPGTQAKKRKTSGSIPDATSEPPKKSTPTQDDLDHAEPAIQVDLPESPKETMDASKSPNPLMTTEDPDAVVITGSGFSKPAATVLSKHVASSSQAIPESGLSKAKLFDYANLEFKELCSGFASRLEASYEMEQNLLKMLNNKHEVNFVILILFPVTPKGRVISKKMSRVLKI